jgi:protein-disulfide isomerase
VNGTPSFFINGSRYDGPKTVDGLIDALNQAR